MNGEERRKEILQMIKGTTVPISGTELSKKLGVSRQIIVQDIALLRAADYSILSTTKGYLLESSSPSITRVFKLCHTDEEIEKELNCIIDLGGRVLDVFVNHKVYGKIHAQMNIHSRKDIQDFMENLKKGVSKPLKNITSGYHYHTIEADSEKTLDLIEQELKKIGYLIDKNI